MIASQLDLPVVSQAQSTQNLPAAYPVVERDGALESPFVGVVEQVMDAVVNISARNKKERTPWWFGRASYSTSTGSGFFFREDGYVLTNAHVVSQADEVVVRTSSGYEYEATVIGADPLTDLAVLKVDPEEKITVVPFGDSENLRVGDWAIAIGNPFPDYGLERTVTVGVISAMGRNNLRFSEDTPLYQNYIQTDASINPGNSGGPLLNLNGEAIGVNAAISSPTGSSVGIGFAIPINMARAIVPDLIATGKVSRGYLGVGLHTVTRREATQVNLEAVRGVVIDTVFENSPAGDAGLRAGDIVTRFNGKEVNNSDQFSVLVSTVKAGMIVPIEVLRDGQHQTIEAKLMDREVFLASYQNRQPQVTDKLYRWQGMSLATFTKEIADDLGMVHVEGLLVMEVAHGSPAYRASIVQGTVVVQVNNTTVVTVDDLKAQMSRKGKRGERIPLLVQYPNGSFARRVLRP